MLDLLLEAVLRATLIAAAALVALLVLRVHGADVRHRVWTVVMLAMLVLPLAIVWAPDVSLRVLPSTQVDEATVAPQPAEIEIAPAAPLERAPSGVAQLTPAEPSRSWQSWVLAVYFAGVAVMLTRLAIGTVRVRLLARGATVVNGLMTSARIATPFTFGLLKPKVLLPAGWELWSPAQLAVVLDHERAHVGRRDPLVQWLALLNRAVFWFHPLAWWLERHLAALAEEACDAAVLARGHDPADYSEQLLELARRSNRRPMPLLPGMPMPGSALQSRLTKILDGDLERTGSRAAGAGAAVLVTMAAAALGTVSLAQEVTAPRTLLDVYERALENDPTVREAEARYRAVAAEVRGSSNVSAQVTAELEAIRQDFLLRVAEPYFAAVTAERALAERQATREALSRHLEQTERRFEVGLIELTDVHEARAVFDHAVADELTAQRALDDAQHRLREIVGEPVGRLRPLVENLPLTPPDPGDAEGWIETALQQNPELAAARLRAESADGNRADRDTARDLERTERRIERETRAAYTDVVAEISRAMALEQAVRSSQQALQATRAGFEAGARSTADVLMAQNSLRHVETAHALRRYEYALNMLRLRGLAGNLTQEELDLTSSWFE